MSRGSDPILSQVLLQELEQDQHDLSRLELDPETREFIAARLERAKELVWMIDTSQRNAIHEIRYGTRPRRAEREERNSRKRAA